MNSIRYNISEIAQEKNVNKMSLASKSLQACRQNICIYFILAGNLKLTLVENFIIKLNFKIYLNLINS